MYKTQSWRFGDPDVRVTGGLSQIGGLWGGGEPGSEMGLWPRSWSVSKVDRRVAAAAAAVAIISTSAARAAAAAVWAASSIAIWWCIVGLVKSGLAWVEVVAEAAMGGAEAGGVVVVVDVSS